MENFIFMFINWVAYQNSNTNHQQSALNSITKHFIIYLHRKSKAPL